jgi:uncharacterized protein YjbI with pentapeptide repeats
MPRRSAIDKKVEEKAEPVAANESVETQDKVEETQPNEIIENELENSKVETIENPVVETKKRRFGYKWIFISLLALILVVLLFIYFADIKNFFFEDVSRIYVIGGATVALIVSLLVWYVPKRQVKKLANEPSEEKLTNFEREEKRLKLEDDTRKTLAQIVGGVFLIAGLFVTYNTYRLGTDNYRLGLEQQKISIQKQDLDRRGQITDRFNKAVEHLGNDEITVRLGGLYALEQILRDSPEEHETVIEVIATYIRERSKINQLNEGISSKSGSTNLKRVSTDIQTALRILTRRPTGEGRNEDRIDLHNTNFQGAYLTKTEFGKLANLRDATLDFVNFQRATLDNVDFTSAMLSGANFNHAAISGSNFTRVWTYDANFSDARITSGNFSEAQMDGTNFNGADLAYVNFNGASLFNSKFNNANLLGTTFNNAEINAVDLSGVRYLKSNQLEQSQFKYILINNKKLDRESALKYFREKEAEK